YAGVMPQMLAELLGVPALTYATQVTASNGEITIHRQTNTGYEVVEASLPAVVSVTAGVVEPRYPTFKGIMDAKKKDIEELSAADLGLDTPVLQTVSNVEPAPEREAGVKVEDEGDAHLKIIAILEQKKVIGDGERMGLRRGRKRTALHDRTGAAEQGPPPRRRHSGLSGARFGRCLRHARRVRSGTGSPRRSRRCAPLRAGLGCDRRGCRRPG